MVKLELVLVVATELFPSLPLLEERRKPDDPPPGYADALLSRLVVPELADGHSPNES